MDGHYSESTEGGRFPEEDGRLAGMTSMGRSSCWGSRIENLLVRVEPDQKGGRRLVLFMETRRKGNMENNSTSSNERRNDEGAS